jgi:hypothetical protein
LLTFCKASLRRHPLISASMAYNSPIRFRASSVSADGVRTYIVDLAAGMSPAGSFRYLSIAVQFVEPGVRIRLQNTAEAGRWLCGWMPFLSGL